MPGNSFQERFRSKNTAKVAAEASHRIAKSTDWYVKVHDAQLARLLEIEPKATQLFLILLRENLRHHGRPFVLPSDKLVVTPGLSRNRLRLMLRQLELAGLVLITNRPRKSPVIRVPLAL
jgi:hypothetical protein